jgi:hypothetical protein
VTKKARGDIPHTVVPRHASAERPPRLTPRVDKKRGFGETKRGAFGATKREAFGTIKRGLSGGQKRARVDKIMRLGLTNGVRDYKMGSVLKAHDNEQSLKFN